MLMNENKHKVENNSMLKNKKILIAGLANKHSIAAGIAQAMHAQGAELAFTYQSERLKGNVEKIAAELGSRSYCLNVMLHLMRVLQYVPGAIKTLEVF